MNQIAINIEHIEIGDLKPDPANPRRISDQELEALTRSIREFGLIDPIIARREDKTVIGGHQRLLAARRLGYKTVPVVFVDLTMEKARLLNIALNKITGSFDQELLARLLSELNQTPEIDLTLTGFDDDDLKKLIKSLDAREKRERLEDFDLEAALEQCKSQPITKPGDLWFLGDHLLLCADATDLEAVQCLMGEYKAAMAFTDPPYNVDYGNHGPAKGRRSIANDNLGTEFQAFLVKSCHNILEFTDGAVYICMSSSELHTLQSAFISAGGYWSTFIIWAKNTFTLGRSDYQRQYEPILYGWREGAQHHWCGDRDQGDVWRVEKPTSSPLHPTMKPLALIEKAIENSSKRGDKVLDLFLGSGSTLIACERTGRTCCGIELEPLYVDIAVKRWEAFTGEKARLSEDEKP
ncbi:MAG: site-specific DNA-methyltransferase [Dehalococcoidia bacterium]|jgi:DNA modification methylase